MIWRLHHKGETVSTNLDARAGAPGDVFTADFQTAGRGRLDHRWLSKAGENLTMSVVLAVEGLSPLQVSTLPLAVGLAVLEGLSPFVGGLSPFVGGLSPHPRGLSPFVGGLSPMVGLALKWPNDVLYGGRKLCGILCERVGTSVVAGIGVNVNQRVFAPELQKKAVSLCQIMGTDPGSLGTDPRSLGTDPSRNLGTDPGSLGTGPGSFEIGSIRDILLESLGAVYGEWRTEGFSAIYPRIREVDALRGQTLEVWRTEADESPVRGICGGILPDGALDVGGEAVYAGEAHVVCAR